MNDFSDFVLSSPDEATAETKEKIKLLTSHFEAESFDEPPSLEALIRSSKSAPFGILFPKLDDLTSLKKAIVDVNVDFILCEQILVPVDALKQLLKSCRKPVWFVAYNCNEVTLIQRRMQGFSGYLLPLGDGMDHYQIQLMLEFGRDYGMESGVCALTNKSFRFIQTLDTQLVRISSACSKSSIAELANTRCLVVDANSDWEPNEEMPWENPFGIVLNSQQLDL